jgi:hypothetical protein
MALALVETPERIAHSTTLGTLPPRSRARATDESQSGQNVT